MMKSHSPLFLMFANLAKKQIKEIDIHEVKTQMAQTQPPFLVDVREDHEWQNGHLPDAIHLCKGVIERDIEKIITDYHAPVILYCSGGFRSAIAAKSIQEMGYKNVMSMESGSTAWTNAGYPIVKD